MRVDGYFYGQHGHKVRGEWWTEVIVVKGQETELRKKGLGGGEVGGSFNGAE